MPQMLVQGAFKLLGVDLSFPETPHSLALGFAIIAAILLIADKYLPAHHEATPRAHPHDIQLFARFRTMFDDNLMYFLRTHDFGGSFSNRIFKVGDEYADAILDRLVHNAHRIELEGDSMRRTRGKQNQKT